MFTPGSSMTVPPMVSVFTQGIGWVTEAVLASAPASATVSTTAAYYGIFIPSSCVVRRVWWANGSNVAGGATLECGVYADAGFKPGAKLVSGSATQGNASEVQFVDVTDTALPPGLYWIAFTSSTTSNTTLFLCNMTAAYDAAYRFQQAATSPLPATATPAESSGNIVYLCGFATTDAP